MARGVDPVEDGPNRVLDAGRADATPQDWERRTDVASAARQCALLSPWELLRNRAERVQGVATRDGTQVDSKSAQLSRARGTHGCGCGCGCGCGSFPGYP